MRIGRQAATLGEAQVAAFRSPSALWDEVGCLGRGEEGLAFGDGDDTIEEGRGSLAFGDITLGAGLAGGLDGLPRVVHGEDDDGDLGMILQDLARGGQAIHVRHGDIHDDNVGAQGGRLGDGVVAINGFAAHFEAGM